MRYARSRTGHVAIRPGADSITIRGGGAYVVYNVTNGNFYGETPDGVEFENASMLDGTPWFDALLNFFMAGAPV